MVLADLGRRINSAFSDLNRSPVIDEKTLDTLLKDLCAALLSSDVNVKLVSNLRNKVKTKVTPQLEKLIAAPTRQKQVVQKAVYDELVALVDPTSGTGSADPTLTTSSSTSKLNQRHVSTSSEYNVWQPKKGKSNVIMFVGLQGAGKTTSCTKLAVHYQRKGFKTSLVCADTFRAGAFDQLKQNATKAKIPFFGSYTETDPVIISVAGVTKFKQEKFEVIIVDTSGRHRQEAELFEEMKQISRGVEPNLTIMVLDGAMGQAAESQSRAFKEAADFGAIIVTKMDGHAKGGGAISAVAATSTPIIFIGTGEHLHDLERFAPGPFISKMLGMGDIGGFLEQMKDIQDSQPVKKQEEMRERIERGEFSVRDLRDQLTNISKMGPLSKIASMIPGMSNIMGGMGAGGDDDASQRMKRMLFIFDAMTMKELDSDGTVFSDRRRMDMGKEKSKEAKGKQPAPEGEPRVASRRVLRIARGSGTSVDEVEALLMQHSLYSKMVKNAGGKRRWEQQQAQQQAMQQAKSMGLGGGGGRGGRSKQQAITLDQLVKMNPQQRQQVLKQAPPAVRQQIEDAGGVEAAYAMYQAQQRGSVPNRRPGAGGGGGLPAMGGVPGLGGGFPGLGGGGMPDPATVKRMMEQMGINGVGDLAKMFDGSPR